MTVWTDELKERAKTMWADGISATQIAAALPIDVSRNAVIGVVTRAGLARRTGPSRPGVTRAPAVKKVRGQNAGLDFGTRKLGDAAKARPIIAGNGAVHEAPTPRPPHVVVPARAWVPLPNSAPRPWTDRGRGCNWPVDVAGAEVQHSCCEPKAENDPLYCVPHRKLATSSSQPSTSAKARANELIRSTRRYAA